MHGYGNYIVFDSSVMLNRFEAVPKLSLTFSEA
jgi:hypothetical protein